MREKFDRRRDRLERDGEAHEQLVREQGQKQTAEADQLEQQRRTVIDIAQSLKERQQHLNADQLDLERQQKLERNVVVRQK